MTEANKTVFYAWQSQLPSRCNRALIEDALSRAIQQINTDAKLDVPIALDQDARGTVGSLDISTAILSKIDGCSAFVADVTPVGSLTDGKSTPNPNVLFELGYAWHCLGEAKILLVFNKAFGKPEELPFDIAKRCLVAYNFPDDPDSKPAEPRSHLAAHFESSLAVILENDVLAPLRKENVRDVDIALFKAGYEAMSNGGQPVRDYHDVLADGARLGLSTTDIEESTQILDDTHLWKASAVLGSERFGHVSATGYGAQWYYTLRADPKTPVDSSDLI